MTPNDMHNYEFICTKIIKDGTEYDFSDGINNVPSLTFTTKPEREEDTMEDQITISKDEYDALTNDAYQRDIITRALFGSAKLNYSGNGLVFNDSVIDHILRYVCWSGYTRRLNKKEEAEEAEKVE